MPRAALHEGPEGAVRVFAHSSSAVGPVPGYVQQERVEKLKGTVWWQAVRAVNMYQLDQCGVAAEEHKRRPGLRSSTRASTQYVTGRGW